MNLSDSLVQAYQTKWSFVNSFSIQFQFPVALKEVADWTNYDDDKIQLNIISVDTPQLTNSPIETFIANKWVIQNGRDELYRFTVTFRDSDQLNIYRKFVKMYKSTKELYFDDAKIAISIFKDADWQGEIEDNLLFHFDDAIIENISQVQFNNTTENQIAEFAVGFKCPSYILK